MPFLVEKKKFSNFARTVCQDSRSFMPFVVEDLSSTIIVFLAYNRGGSGRASPQARPVQVAGPEQPQLDPVLRRRAAEAQEPQREAGPAARRDPRRAQPPFRPDLLHRERVPAQRALQLHAGQGEHCARARHSRRVQVRRNADRGRDHARTTKANTGKNATTIVQFFWGRLIVIGLLQLGQLGFL